MNGMLIKRKFSGFLKSLTLSFLYLIVTQTSSGQKVIYAADFGVKPGSFDNASPALRKAIDACKSYENVSLQLPGGRIDIWPDGAVKRELYISNSTEDDTLSKVKTIGFFLENFKNLTIEGNNTLVILHGKMISFAILNSENIRITNISFDYERPTMSELTITSFSENQVEAMIHPDSKYLIDHGKLIFYGEGWKMNSSHAIVFEPDSNTMKYSSFQPFAAANANEISPFYVKFEGDFSSLKLRAGDILTVRDPYRDNCGAFINHSKNIAIENSNMQYMHGLGIVSQFSENIQFHTVKVAPREASGRIISSFADCFHFSGCKGKILIDNCLTSGSHDDPVNVHGTQLKIISVEDGNKLIVRFMHHQTYGFEAFFAGDSIAFIKPQTLQPLAYARLKSARLINLHEMELATEHELPQAVTAGLCIENLTWTPEVTIRDCRFERTNTRGVLVTTPRKVLIENNIFFKTGMHTILIANDASGWFESGAVHDVTIRKNTFTECGYNLAPGSFVVSISPENHIPLPGYFVHQNINIENNIFNVYDYPVLTARSVENLSFTGNTIVQAQLGKRITKRPSFELTACKKVFIDRNSFRFHELPIIKCSQMNKKELKTDIESIFVK